MNHCTSTPLRYAPGRRVSSSVLLLARGVGVAEDVEQTWNMHTTVNFCSSLFKPFLSEESQVNPNRYGAELAWWLARQLAQKGIETSYPNYEDWGWFIEYIVVDDEYWLCCGNIDGEDDQWRVYLRRHAKGLFGKRRAPLDTAVPLLQALRAVLSESPEINGIEWSEDED